MLLLTTLKWDVSAVVSSDFIEHLIVRIHLLSQVFEAKCEGLTEITGLIKRFATDICFLCCKGESARHGMLKPDSTDSE